MANDRKPLWLQFSEMILKTKLREDDPETHRFESCLQSGIATWLVCGRPLQDRILLLVSNKTTQKFHQAHVMGLGQTREQAALLAVQLLDAIGITSIEDAKKLANTLTTTVPQDYPRPVDSKAKN